MYKNTQEAVTHTSGLMSESPPTLSAAVAPPTLPAAVAPPSLSAAVVPPPLSAAVAPPTLCCGSSAHPLCCGSSAHTLWRCRKITSGAQGSDRFVPVLDFELDFEVSLSIVI